MPELLLPEGFEAHSTNFIIKGVCPHCHHSE
jgi:Fur family ferric uptake transcriptional regulator